MADRYTSRIALVVDAPVHVGDVVQAAIAAGDIDRSRPVRDVAEAAEVNWGGRMAKAVVRRLAEDGRDLVRVEAYIGGDGVVNGLQRQAQLLQGLARQLRGSVEGVVDLSARTDRDMAWVNRVAIGAVDRDDAIVVVDEGEGTHWVFSHGAARFDVPDLELYGLDRGQLAGADEVIGHLHDQLLARGLKRADLALPSGTPVYLVPVLEAWKDLPMDWPGIGRAGEDRGPGLDGPRATLSVMHKPRFGRYRTDFAGVLAEL
ncbi:hypothetical protein [Salsipaludibacter albus]|uniref:hypothetical protein n=1 Tax=Salsipaludibacter albus TaxID=2849650 RepID=UPI001EE48A53|nr:hypothetical protein [Salsipaludibacter albus]MBY5164428.1 hypothetical protein [Salsipaludibacter albus]